MSTIITTKDDYIYLNGKNTQISSDGNINISSCSDKDYVIINGSKIRINNTLAPSNKTLFNILITAGIIGLGIILTIKYIKN